MEMKFRDKEEDATEEERNKAMMLVGLVQL